MTAEVGNEPVLRISFSPQSPSVTAPFPFYHSEDIFIEHPAVAA